MRLALPALLPLLALSLGGAAAADCTVDTAFPDATLKPVQTPAELEAKAESEALHEVDDEWDPFEEG